MAGPVPPRKDQATAPRLFDAVTDCPDASSDIQINKSMQGVPNLPSSELIPSGGQQNGTEKMLNFYNPLIPHNMIFGSSTGCQKTVFSDEFEKGSVAYAHGSAIHPEELIPKCAPDGSFDLVPASTKEVDKNNFPHADNQVHEQATGIAMDRDFSDGETDPLLFGVDSSATQDVRSFTSAWPTNGPHERPRINAHPLRRRHFVENEPVTSAGIIPSFTTSAPSMSAILERYRVLDPSMQEALSMEFMYQIRRYSQFFALPTMDSNRAHVFSEIRARAESQVPNTAEFHSNQSSDSVRDQSQSQVHGQSHLVLDAPAQSPLEVEAVTKQKLAAPGSSYAQVTSTTGATTPTIRKSAVSQRLAWSSTNHTTDFSSRISRQRRNNKANKVPSKHCHICCRRPTSHSRHVVCGNLVDGTCRKTICERCFLGVKWDKKVDVQTARSLGLDWKCTHCMGVCPSRAQCFIYGRSSDRRRQRKLEEREAAIRFENQQISMTQEVAAEFPSLEPHAINEKLSSMEQGIISANQHHTSMEEEDAEPSNLHWTNREIDNASPGLGRNAVTSTHRNAAHNIPTGSCLNKQQLPGSYFLLVNADGYAAQGTPSASEMQSAGGSNSIAESCAERPKEDRELENGMGVTTPVTPQTLADTEAIAERYAACQVHNDEAEVCTNYAGSADHAAAW